MANSVELSWIEFEIPDHNPGYPPKYDPADCLPPGCRKCNCDCGCHQAPEPPKPPQCSARPIRYASGEVGIESVDLAADGFGLPWGHTRVFANRLSETTDPGNGNNWQVREWTYLVFPSATEVAVMGRGTAALWFDLVGGAYVPAFSVQHALEADPANNLFRLVGMDGSVTEYVASSGAFQRKLDPAGNAVEVTAYTANGFNPAEVQRAYATGGDTVTESFLYGYADPDVNFPQLTSVTLRRKVNSGSWASVERTLFTYYDAESDNGAAGDLETAETQRWDGAAWVGTGTSLYRYYTEGSEASLLKFVVNPASYARLEVAVDDPLAATDAEVADFADHYFEYDGNGRVVTETVDGGTREFSFVFEESANADGYNSWKTKTTETEPDGTQNVVYSNYAGQTMLHVKKVGSDEWVEFFRFDENGRMDLHALPSAVSGYDEGEADLMELVSGAYTHLRASEGLIRTYTYHTASGFLAGESVQRGQSGDPIPVRAYSYTAREVDGQPDTYFVSAETLYPDAADPLTTTVTSYGYEFFTGTARVKQKETTFPVVPATQNGPDVAAVRTEVFDDRGNLTWVRDENGFITKMVYDVVTGALIDRIDDVDTDEVDDEPDGWETPAGGGLHLVTTTEVDDKGRPTAVTDPAGHVTYTVYKDASFEVRTYRGWDAATDAPTAPTMVVRQDRASGYSETLTMSAAPDLDGEGRPTGEEAISDLRSLLRTYKDASDDVSHADSYFSLAGLTYTTATTLGTEGTHFYRTRYGYDEEGRRDRVVSPAGTITRTVFDGPGRAASEWVGTDDTPATGDWSPANAASMVKVREYEYDGGGIGDSNRTKATEYPGLGADPRVTQAWFDWRNRAVAVKQGVQVSEGAGVHRPIFYTEFDNLGRAVASERYDGDGVAVTVTDGVPNRPDAELLRARSTTEYDDRGRAFRTKTYSVDPADGTVSTSALTSASWFDPRGQVLMAVAPNGPVQKTLYDGLGRVTKSFVSDGATGTAWADASDVSGDTVLSQTEYDYDENGNVIRVAVRERFHDASGTGELGTPASGIGARVSYAGSFFDLANRSVASVNVGTNGGSAWSRPGSVPARSDTALVTSYEYDDAGRMRDVIDPDGRVKRTEYDALGRVTKTVENYTDGTPTANTNKTTTFGYGPAGMTSLTAVLPGGAGQTTAWVYGVTVAGGSGLDSNDVVGETRWPDKVTGAASTGEVDTVTVNSLGQTVTTTDRNGTVHTLSYDVLGRLTSDAVTTLGSGVDGAVRRIETGYGTQGDATLITSFDAATGGEAVNQVRRDFNGLGQLVAEWQEHDGEVDTGSTPKVEYAYSEMASGANHSRQVSVTYPDGYVLTRNYSSGLNSAVSRLSSLSDASGVVEEYDYLGLKAAVRRGHPQSGVDLTYIKQGAEANGEGGDQYAGLDRFGRVVDQRWRKSSDGTHTDRFHYGYDRASNRTYRDNLVNTAFGEVYGSDGLNQIVSFQRGTLNSGKDGVAGAVTAGQLWGYDAAGNVDQQNNNGIPQARTHDRQNEIAAVVTGLPLPQATPLGGSATPVVPKYDHAGNMTRDERGRLLGFDGWNRLVWVSNPTETGTLKTYAYNGLHCRVSETASVTTIDLYHSSLWQVLTEKVGITTSKRYVWSPVYVDALVLRDRDTDVNGTLDERLWAQQDANWNITAVLDESGAAVERYAYTPYGTTVTTDASWIALEESNYLWTVTFQGLRYDAFAGLCEADRRWYSPTLGRWISLDPIRHKSGTSNFYNFEGNNPLATVDPSGLLPPPVIAVLAAIAGCALTPWCACLVGAVGAAVLEVILELANGQRVSLPATLCAAFVGCFAGACGSVALGGALVTGGAGGGLIGTACYFLVSMACDSCKRLCPAGYPALCN